MVSGVGAFVTITLIPGYNSWNFYQESVDFNEITTDEEAKKYMDRFAQPENISKEEVESDMGFTLMMF